MVSQITSLSGNRTIPVAKALNELYTKTNEVVDRLNDITPRNSSDIVHSIQPGGTTSRIVKVPPLAQPNTATVFPPFYTYASALNKIKVTGGNLVFIPVGIPYPIADSAEFTVSSGDYIWLQYDGATCGDWTFNTGTSYPTDRLSIPLATATVDGYGNVTLSYDWNGGDIVVPETFPVLMDGTPTGDAGDIDTDCSFAYTVTTSDGVVDLFGTDTEPDNVRMPKVTYVAGTKGIAWFNDDGTFGFFVLDEYADTEEKLLAVITCVDGSGCYDVTPWRTTVFKGGETDTPTSCT